MSSCQFSIRCKLLMGILPVLALLGFITTALVSAYVRTSFKTDLEKQQFTLASLMAQKLDDQFESYQKTMVSLSERIPRTILNNPQAIERFMDSRPALLEMFDNNVLVFSPEGRLLAETAQRPSRTGQDFSYRDYIVETRRLKKPYISRPFESKLPHKPPVVVFAAPVLDADGNLQAIVAGSINLLRPNLLGRLAESKISDGGYFYLSTADRIMVMHPDHSRLLKPVVKPGVNLLYDRSMQGFEGAGETDNSKGIRMVAAFKRLKSVNWVLVAQLPAAEAYAAVNRAQWLTWGITAVSLIVLALLTIIAASRLLAPLQSLTVQVDQLKQHTEFRPVVVQTRDELEKLAQAFNELMLDLQGREKELQNSRELYQFIADFSQDWIFWRQADGLMLYISPAAQQITGYSIDELLLHPELTTTMIHPDDRELWHQHVCQADQGNQNHMIEYRIFTKDGDLRWLRHTCVSILDHEARLVGVRGTNRDITERKLAILELQENEERFRLIASTAHDAIILVDYHQRVSFWNQAAERLFGVPTETAIGMPIQTWLPSLVTAVDTAEQVEGGSTFELNARHQDGHGMIVELAYSRTRLSGAPVSVVVARDITLRKEAEERLQYVSSHDALTGLYNRAAFEYHVRRLDREGPFPVAVVMADLDGLKQVNDTQGHEAGDRLIQAAAGLLSSSFRTNDIIARLGGDEFVALLPGIPPDVAATKFERMQRRIELYSELPENPKVSLSCGLAQVSGPGGLDQALKLADQLMYQHKATRKRGEEVN